MQLSNMYEDVVSKLEKYQHKCTQKKLIIYNNGGKKNVYKLKMCFHSADECEYAYWLKIERELERMSARKAKAMRGTI